MRVRCSPLVKAKKKPVKAQEVLDRLNSYIDSSSEQPATILYGLWKDQQQAITYKELREAILSGGISQETLSAWKMDYAQFVNNSLSTVWLNAMGKASEDMLSDYPHYFYNPMAAGVQNWIQSHGAEFVTHMAEVQKDAITTMIGYASSGAVTVDELSRLIRPVIGLDERQTKANFKFYNHAKSSLLKDNPNMREKTAEKKAQLAAQKYSEKQHRQRAYSIAQTEMAFAYNKGADEAIAQAQMEGFLGQMESVWSTAGNENVCPVCDALDGKTVDFGEEFDFKGKSLYSGQKRTPPAHTRCRCALMYREVSPPSFESIDRAKFTYRAENSSNPLISGADNGIINTKGFSDGHKGDKDVTSEIIDVYDIDFKDQRAVALQLSNFASKYRNANIEHALIISPKGKAFELIGSSFNVNTRLVGKEMVENSIDIHNHPLHYGYADAFSMEDFREYFWSSCSVSWLVAGDKLYRMSYTGKSVSPAEAISLYKQAQKAVMSRAFESGNPIELEQYEVMQELKRTLKGLEFDEF